MLSYQTPSSKWGSGTHFSNDQGGQIEAKFRRLMGIKGNTSEQSTSSEGQAQGAEADNLLQNLEAEFERSRAFQLSRGAGGKSGIGLGYSGQQ
jgi:hypothetical protein